MFMNFPGRHKNLIEILEKNKQILPFPGVLYIIFTAVMSIFTFLFDSRHFFFILEIFPSQNSTLFRSFFQSQYLLVGFKTNGKLSPAQG